MKEIRKRDIEKIIKAEYADGRRWCGRDCSFYYKLMIDTADAQIWVDCMMENSWNVYHSDTITALEEVGIYVADTEANYINQAVKLLKAAGWIITE